MAADGENVVNMKYSYVVHDADNNTYKSILQISQFNPHGENTEMEFNEALRFPTARLAIGKSKPMATDNSQYENLNHGTNSSIAQVKTNEKDQRCVIASFF